MAYEIKGRVYKVGEVENVSQSFKFLNHLTHHYAHPKCGICSTTCSSGGGH